MEQGARTDCDSAGAETPGALTPAFPRATRRACVAGPGFTHVGIRLIPATSTEPQHDLVGLLRAVPQNLPLSVEAPTRTLARTVPSGDRARRAFAATRAVLAQMDAPS